MSARVGLAANEKLGGIVCLSGYMLGKENIVTAIENGNNRQTPVFVGHGTADQVVSFRAGRAMKECMEENEMTNVEFHE